MGVIGQAHRAIHGQFSCKVPIGKDWQGHLGKIFEDLIAAHLIGLSRGFGQTRLHERIEAAGALFPAPLDTGSPADATPGQREPAAGVRDDR